MSIGALVGRLGALVLAVLLVVGALVWRDRGDDGTPAPDDGGTATPVVAEPGTVRCAAELRICDALAEALGDDVDVVPEDGVVTARALRDASSADVWVTLQSLVDVVGDARDRASRGPLYAPPPGAVGTTPLVLVGWRDRLAVLEDACGVTWACVGEVAAGSWADAGGPPAWGSPKPAHAAPDRSGVGLLVVAQAVASRLDGDPVTARTLDAPDVRSWFADLERAVPSFTPPSGSQLVEMVQFGPSSRDVVGTTAAEAADVLARAGARAADLAVTPSSPPVAATAVVAVPVGGEAPPGLTETVSSLLAEAGWDVPGTTPGVTLPTPIPDAAGDAPVLTGGALEAVLIRWEQVR